MLPVIDKPIYKATILSRKEPVEFVPFTVRESKIMMMAKESNELDSMVQSLKQVLRNCLVDKNINVDKLPMVDLEWLFLNIMARSSGEKQPQFFKCTNQVSGNNCNMVVEFEVNLLTVKIANKEIDRRIPLTDKVGLQMKYPTFEATQAVIKLPETQQDEALAAACIDYVYDADSVYKSEDMQPEELVTFIEGLETAKYSMVEQFLNNCPIITETIEKTCPKCGFHHKITLEGLEDFFT
jgi:hypothetical protein